MALPPTIPTSFVPHFSGAPDRRPRSNITNFFGLFAYIILGVTVILALSVFAYSTMLDNTRSAKDAELAKQVEKIDQAAVEKFVRLSNRLNFGNELLQKHIAFSNFFTALGTLLPATVRFSSLHISLDSSGAVKMEGAGTAKSFNALAVASAAFSSDGRIKDAIFSKINVNKENSVSFGLSATLDPALVRFSPEYE